MVIRRVGVWSASRLYGGIMASLGVIVGIFFALAATLGGLAGAAANSESGSGLAAGGLGALFGVGAIILAPLFYGCIGLIAGAIGAALYNLFAGLFGGLELEIQQ
jgi:hypothetical protein